MDEKQYLVKDSCDYFRAGASSATGVQVLCSRQADVAVCLKFSADGTLIGWEVVELSDPRNEDDVACDIEAWMDQRGFARGTIHIRKFCLPELAVEIKDLPDYLREYVDSPSNFPIDRQKHLALRVKEWIDSGDYALIWGEEFEMSRDGEVEST